MKIFTKCTLCNKKTRNQILISFLALIVNTTFAINHIELIKKSEKAVVKIIEKKSDKLIGTAFIISAEGLALSCYHVMNNKSELRVQDKEGNYFEIDSVIGYSEDEDYLLFKIRKSNGQPLSFIEVSTKAVEKGSEVIAIGHVAGYPYLATNGTIAGYVEKNDEKDNIFSLDKNIHEVFFTAPVYYASSGSPLITADDGKVVGIVKRLTSYGYTHVPNINVCFDITRGVNVLKNCESITYTYFLDSIINKVTYYDNFYWADFWTEEDYDDYEETEEENKDEKSIINTKKYAVYIEDNQYRLTRQFISDAKYLASQNKNRKAFKKIKKAFNLTNDPSSVINDFVDILIMCNRTKKAERVLNKALMSYPDNYKMWQKLADISLINGKFNHYNIYSEKAFLLKEDYFRKIYK